MDLNSYFDPVGLEKPPFGYMAEDESFSHHISVHTPNQSIRDLNSFRVALIGVREDTNAFIKGSGQAPDEIRSRLFQLRKINRNLRIYDLGNLKKTGSASDTYYALRDVLLELAERDIIALILGGSQDISRGVFLALAQRVGLQQVLTVDAMLDLTGGDGYIDSRNYLNLLFDPKLNSRFSMTNLGHQAYFVSDSQLKQLESSYLESIRLGDVRRNMQSAEPMIRDSSFVGIDLGAVRHADAPGASIPSPNGFTGDEICQITRYAGLSDKVSVLGFFEMNPSTDVNGQTAHLTAQAAWYFLEGLSQRICENPATTPEHIRKFIVSLNTADHDIVFHKSTLSERWWMEIPVKNPATGYNFFISCAYEDYQQACNQEIPDRWWRFLHRLGNESDEPSL